MSVLSISILQFWYLTIHEPMHFIQVCTNKSMASTCQKITWGLVHKGYGYQNRWIKTEFIYPIKFLFICMYHSVWIISLVLKSTTHFRKNNNLHSFLSFKQKLEFGGVEGWVGAVHQKKCLLPRCKQRIGRILLSFESNRVWVCFSLCDKMALSKSCIPFH